MKKHLLLFVLLFTMYTGYAQQWIDQKYAYDSLLNVTYGTAVNFNGTVDTLKMDIYTPICDDVNHVSRRPLMVWIHGGAFLAGDKNDVSITNLCKIFARRGYVTASIDYRLGFVADDAAWTCNFPNYSCVFAADSAEWHRAYYRGVQDGKGALRYLINRNAQFRIDTANVFLAGESAGSIVALGVGLMDTLIERRPETFVIGNVPAPHSGTYACVYNTGETFSGPIARPDLGGIDGTIEPTTVNYTIKGIGNMYGAMLNDLLKNHKANTPKPAIYSFHQPCDMVVPIDSGNVYTGLSWCMTNGYGCYAIANTAKLYGSRVFSNWNTTNNYGYTIHNEFTATNFPYSFLIGQGSCYDQVNNPCHAYDNVTLRQNNLANFFAPYVSTNPICDTMLFLGGMGENRTAPAIKLFPNPAAGIVNLECESYANCKIKIVDMLGKEVIAPFTLVAKTTPLSVKELPAGVYFVVYQHTSGVTSVSKLIKE